MFKHYFNRYLQDVRGVSPRTVAHYNTSLRTVERYLKAADKLHVSIFEIDTLAELRELQAQLLALPEFVAQDEKGNRMYTAGLNRYIEFASDAESALAIPSAIEKLDMPIIRPVRPRQQQVAGIRWIRDRIIVRQVLSSARFRCEVDPDHTTFVTEASGDPYLEGHHLIPLSRQDRFPHSLDIYANLIGLCPSCHRFLHFARRPERNTALSTLYAARAERLRHSGITLSRDDFLALAC